MLYSYQEHEISPSFIQIKLLKAASGQGGVLNNYIINRGIKYLHAGKDILKIAPWLNIPLSGFDIYSMFKSLEATSESRDQDARIYHSINAVNSAASTCVSVGGSVAIIAGVAAGTVVPG